MTKPLPEEIERTRKRMSDREKIEVLRAALQDITDALEKFIVEDCGKPSGGPRIDRARAALAATEKE